MSAQDIFGWICVLVAVLCWGINLIVKKLKARAELTRFMNERAKLDAEAFEAYKAMIRASFEAEMEARRDQIDQE